MTGRTSLQDPISTRELMAFEAARQITNGDRVILGTGLPLLAGVLAQRLHAPEARLVVESGVIYPRITRAPVSVVDPRLMSGASRLGALIEVLGGHVQRGLIDVGFIGAAQIDEFANINSTWVPGPGRRVRLAGSGGANDIASHCPRIVVLTTHERRRFPKRCDYITSPGFLSGSGGRSRVGLPPLRVRVITDLCVMDGDSEEGRLTVTALMPEVDIAEVLSEMDFEPGVAQALTRVPAPGARQLQLLRTEVDPAGNYFPDSRT